MDSGQRAESKTVVSWRFSWEAVKPSVARALCVAAYADKGQAGDVERMLLLQDGVIAAQAAKVLGSPPGAGHEVVLAPVLRDEWLPTLTRAQLEPIATLVQLGLTGRERSVELRTRSQMRDFLSRRRATDHLGSVLRKAFIEAHKVGIEHEAGVAPPAVPAKWGRILLKGQGAPDRREPYAHQRQAWQRLTDMGAATSREDRAGLMVLPTGAGKTYTMVHWLIQRLASDPALRVLWLADQQELVDQAAHAFVDHAAVLPASRARLMRVIHGGGDPASALADPEVDVVCATRQSVTGAGFTDPARKRLEAFLARPCVVVVDEAHHAVSPTYQRLLDYIVEKAPMTMLVGLTATPWPRGGAMTARLRERFPVRIADIETRDLVKTGVLATPRLHTVDTHELVKLTPEEAREIAGRDVPASVLRDLDRESRNRLIVNAWLSRQEEWGKTLVFACDIAHADRLGALFAAEDVTTEVLHSRSEDHRTRVLTRFRESTGNSVLVSVGMLLEGVDVPDARTAFLARPTSSRIVLRQMIGRVLRGVAGVAKRWRTSSTCGTAGARTWTCSRRLSCPASSRMRTARMGTAVCPPSWTRSPVRRFRRMSCTGSPRRTSSSPAGSPVCRPSARRSSWASTSWGTSTCRCSPTRRIAGSASSTPSSRPSPTSDQSRCSTTCRSRSRWSPT
ncbi:DEAD/DEAH box helicase family protein [Oryzihumus leptocrescens]|uniref:DEAD/DEAH box helicase family protein n=1 Tax=Oryzihumus leptocrescens TaxID=297536 RepID=UPI00114E4F9B